jgi:hypothetical protein
MTVIGSADNTATAALNEPPEHDGAVVAAAQRLD